MRRIGAALMIFGAAIGVVVAGGTVMRFNLPDLPFWAALGLAKLAFVSSLSIMGVGAALVRIAKRREKRESATLPR